MRGINPSGLPFFNVSINYKDRVSNLKILAILLTVLSLFGCGPAATFDSPQPNGGRALTSFPSRLRAHYIEPGGDALIVVTATQVILQAEEYIKMDRDSFGISLSLCTNSSETSPIRYTDVAIDGDSLLVRATLTDTLFDMNAGDILKKFRGHYFLNAYYDDTTWEVRQISLKNGILTLAIIHPEDDLKKLQAITESPDDTTTTHFALNRREFKEFVKNKGFSSAKCYLRLPEKPHEE